MLFRMRTFSHCESRDARVTSIRNTSLCACPDWLAPPMTYRCEEFTAVSVCPKTGSGATSLVTATCSQYLVIVSNIHNSLLLVPSDNSPPKTNNLWPITADEWRLLASGHGMLGITLLHMLVARSYCHKSSRKSSRLSPPKV